MLDAPARVFHSVIETERRMIEKSLTSACPMNGEMTLNTN